MFEKVVAIYRCKTTTNTLFRTPAIRGRHVAFRQGVYSIIFPESANRRLDYL